MKLIVGLGNPGLKYRKTKHNVGFLCIDHYVKQNNLKLKNDNKFKGEWLKLDNMILLKPHTFMNLSGQSIQSTISFFDINPEDVLVIYDDLSLPFNKIRLREKGSAGGHNGIKSIIQHLKTEDFKRIKIGIDANPLIDTKDYVLGKFSKTEFKELETSYSTVSNIIDDFAANKPFTHIMNKYN